MVRNREALQFKVARIRITEKNEGQDKRKTPSNYLLNKEQNSTNTIETLKV